MPLTVIQLEIIHWLWVKYGWQGRTTGSKGPGRGPSSGEYGSGGTGGSHPGIKLPDLPPGVRPIFHSPGGLMQPGGGAPPGGSTDQVVPGVATLE